MTELEAMRKAGRGFPADGARTTQVILPPKEERDAMEFIAVPVVSGPVSPWEQIKEFAKKNQLIIEIVAGALVAWYFYQKDK